MNKEQFRELIAEALSSDIVNDYDKASNSVCLNINQGDIQRILAGLEQI